MRDVLKDAYPGHRADLRLIKLFTSPIMGRYASDPNSPNRQMRYHNALQFAPSGTTEIISGYHAEVTKHGYRVDTRAAPGERILVRVMEEKQTDVNIGLHMYRDVVKGDVEQIVLVSGDSDLAPAIVFPALSKNPNARRSGQLEKLSTWTRRHLTDAQLKAAQLPISVVNRKGKAIKKPTEW